MEDPILISRLEALRNNLDAVSANLASAAWQGDEQSRATTRAELLGESLLWAGLETLRTDIDKRLRDLQQIDKELAKAAVGDPTAVSVAWSRFGKIQAGAQELLRECLEIIGTLAIREKNLDHRLLYVADELIRDCLTLSTGGSDYYLLVHSLSDTFSRAKSRIIRLRFPEWTIWDLPLAAHDLGHVAIAGILLKEQGPAKDDATLTPFLDEQRDLLVQNDAALLARRETGGDSAAEADRWADGRVRVLLADAFATYTMGPAYAYSAIMLRLSPNAASRDVPSDALRAQVILSTLGWMNDNTGAVGKPYSDVLQQQTANWQSALDANPVHQLDGALINFAAQLASQFGADVSNYAFSRTAKYPPAAANQGWTRARDWANHWLGEWKNRQDLTLPDNENGKLRDVLNATWLCRSSLMSDRETTMRAHVQLARVGQELCTRIIETATGRRPLTSGPAVAQGAGR